MFQMEKTEKYVIKRKCLITSSWTNVSLRAKKETLKITFKIFGKISERTV